MRQITPKILGLALTLSVIISMAWIGSLLIHQIACEGQPINNDVATTEAQQIYGDRIVGQTFVAPREGLNRIDLFLLTYGRQNTPQVTLRLLDLSANPGNPLEGHEVYRTSFSAATVKDYAWRTFEFESRPDSAQKPYMLAIESPEASPGNAIAVGGIERDVYLPGTAYLGPVPLPADMAFRVCFEMNFSEKISILAGQLTQNRSGLLGNFGFYVGSLLVYGLLVVILFWNLGKLQSRVEERNYVMEQYQRVEQKQPGGKDG